MRISRQHKSTKTCSKHTISNRTLHKFQCIGYITFGIYMTPQVSFSHKKTHSVITSHLTDTDTAPRLKHVETIPQKSYSWWGICEAIAKLLRIYELMDMAVIVGVCVCVCLLYSWCAEIYVSCIYICYKIRATPLPEFVSSNQWTIIEWCMVNVYLVGAISTGVLLCVRLTQGVEEALRTLYTIWLIWCECTVLVDLALGIRGISVGFRK